MQASMPDVPPLPSFLVRVLSVRLFHQISLISSSSSPHSLFLKTLFVLCGWICGACILRPGHLMGRSLTGVLVVPLFSSGGGDFHFPQEMSSPWCSASSQIYFKVNQSWGNMLLYPSISVEKRPFFTLKGTHTEHFGQMIVERGSKIGLQWSFVGGSSVLLHPITRRFVSHQKCFSPSASWFTSSQVASNAFNLGTVAVLPFYTLMVLAPNAKLTKRTMESSIPYIVLGILYAYVLYLSWTPDTIRLMFASKYWLPELPGIAKMFSNETTIASAWVHLLVVDLFAARQIFHDGLQNKIETRHSVSLCLLCCPVGIVTHAITKVLSKKENLTK